MAREREYEAPIGNYYGTPTVYREDGKWYLALEDYSGESRTEVTVEFAEQWIAQFDEMPS